MPYLKNGGYADLYRAATLVRYLRGLLGRKPDQARAVIALAHGRPAVLEGITKDTLSASIPGEPPFLNRDGSLSAEAIDIIRSSYRDADGGVFVNPIDPERPQDRIDAERFAKLIDNDKGRPL
jgi:hypothetical protein